MIWLTLYTYVKEIAICHLQAYVEEKARYVHDENTLLLSFDELHDSHT